MISELNGFYWDEAMFACYNAFDAFYSDAEFYDFIYSYCGFSI